MAAPSKAAAATRVICGSGHAGKVRCHAIVVTNSLGSPTVSPGPRGLTPAVLRDAYQLPATTAGAGQVIAIVDAYDDPRAAIDLAAYRTQFHLGTCNNRGAAPCFRKVNQRGGAPLPRANEGWAGEISLDLDMASAICPRCRLLLVEADSSSVADLGLAEDAAARLGASVISNSFGGPESIGSAATAAHFHHPGVAIVASSGDDGFGTNFPASSGDVTAVGGTTLRSSGTAHGWTEQAWSGSGSGCVNDINGNSIQGASGTGCGFPGFDGMSAANSLGYVAQSLEAGIPVAYAYVSDVHDNHSGFGAYGPGEAGYVAALHDYDNSFATFFARLQADGFDKSNTLFVVTADENDHFAGQQAQNCDGVTTPCVYNTTPGIATGGKPAHGIFDVTNGGQPVATWTGPTPLAADGRQHAERSARRRGWLQHQVAAGQHHRWDRLRHLVRLGAQLLHQRPTAGGRRQRQCGGQPHAAHVRTGGGQSQCLRSLHRRDAAHARRSLSGRCAHAQGDPHDQ